MKDFVYGFPEVQLSLFNVEIEVIVVKVAVMAALDRLADAAPAEFDYVHDFMDSTRLV